jgi:hypothetical protein
MPRLSANYPLARKDGKAARGLRLYETFQLPLPRAVDVPQRRPQGGGAVSNPALELPVIAPTSPLDAPPP